MRTGAVIILASAILAGCGGGGSTTATNPAYLDQYTSGRYTDSYKAASREADATRGSRREHAGLTAGLSAYAMDRHTEAEHWLRPLVDSTDPGTSGQAAATLGLIAQRRNDHARAADLLSFASGRLTGPDSARAAVYAGDSYRALGKPADAERMFAHARSEAGSHSEIIKLLAQRRSVVAPTTVPAQASAAPRPTSAPPPPVPAGSQSGAYTISLGAFSQFARAQQVADAARAKAGNLGLGVPRVVAVSARTGATLYSVRVGRFQSRAEAERHRGAFGPEAAIAMTSSE